MTPALKDYKISLGDKAKLLLNSQSSRLVCAYDNESFF